MFRFIGSLIIIFLILFALSLQTAGANSLTDYQKLEQIAQQYVPASDRATVKQVVLVARSQLPGYKLHGEQACGYAWYEHASIWIAAECMKVPDLEYIVAHEYGHIVCISKGRTKYNESEECADNYARSKGVRP